jgi:Uma2 family endonuclease
MNAIPQYPRRHAISAQEYLRMAEASIFTDDVRLELMDGEIIEMAPIGSQHAAVVNTLNSMLVRAADDRGIVSVQNPVIIGTQSVPQPDLLLLQARGDWYSKAHPRAADVLLVIEVSDTSLRFDLDRKIPAYARADIAEAWVVDLENRAVHQFSNPQAGHYRNRAVLAGLEQIRVVALPGLAIRVCDLFHE